MSKFYFLIFILGLFLIPAPSIAAVTYDDLLADSITVSPAFPKAKEKVVITVKVKNNGNKNIFLTTGVSGYSYNFPNFTLTKLTYNPPSVINYTAPGGYITYTFEGNFSKNGKTNLSFTADSGNVLNEGDQTNIESMQKAEANNQVSKEIEVGGVAQVDLAIDAIEYSPANFLMGDTVDVIIKVKNKSNSSLVNGSGLNEAAIEAELFNFYLNSKISDTLPSEANPLDPDGIFKFTYRGIFQKGGSYTFNFKIDKNNDLIETDEENNATSTPITIYETREEASNFQFLDFQAWPISSSSLLVKWETNEATDGKVIYEEKTHDNPDLESSLSSEKTKHEATIKNLKPDMFYYYKILGNSTNDAITKASAFKYITTPKDDQVIFTKNPGLTFNQATGNIFLEWETNLLANSTLYYKRNAYSNYSATTTSGTLTRQQFSLAGFSAGEYNYYVVASSTVNTVASSSVGSFIISDGQAQSQEAVLSEIVPPVTPPASEEIRVIESNGSNTFDRLKGSIVLKVEDNGEAWYLNPLDSSKYFLGRPRDAFAIMRNLGIGITDQDLAKIPEGDIYTPENERGGWDLIFAKKQAGKIFLQVEKNGEAWYVNPADKKRYYLGRPDDAFKIMRSLSIGITNEDFVGL